MLFIFYNKISEHIDTKMKIKKILIIFLFSFVLLPLFASAAGPFDYTPLEKIPGSDAATSTTIDFYQYIYAVYKFGIWAVGIVALFMLVFGGYTYITSAGNNSSMETAKKIITDAIVGVIMALTAYLLLYVINPDLVKMKKLTPVAVVPAPTITGVPGAGTCSTLSTGPCSVDNLKSTCFSSDPEKWSAICNKESGGKETLISNTDKCQDGTKFSIGLFQINMINSASSVSGCSGIFSTSTSGGDPSCSKYGSSQGSCLACIMNSVGTGYCSSWNCSIKNSGAYSSCLSQLENSAININLACSLSKNGATTGPWQITAKACGL